MADRTAASGLAVFARYAYPPNRLGYCGPADHEALLGYAQTGEIDARLARMAKAFDGPLPYLRTLAGGGDPFSGEVVEAYWIGNELLEELDPGLFRRQVEATFKGQPTVDWGRVERALPHGLPHHSFQVLVTYPWLGLLDRPGGHAIRVLDQCRIRWGQVQDVRDGAVAVDSRPLTYADGRLGLGGVRRERELVALRGARGTSLGPGDWVAMHWQWVCDRLTPRQVRDLERYSTQQVAMVNEWLL